MKRDEIKFYQKRWSKRDHRKTHYPDSDEQLNTHSLFDDLSLEEEPSKENSPNQEIYTPHKSEGEIPRPIISLPSKIIKDKEDAKLAESRKRMSSFRKEAAPMQEHSDESVDEESAFESSEEAKGTGWKRGKQGNPFLAEILSMLEESQSGEWSIIEEQTDTKEEENPFEEHSILTDIAASLDEQSGFKNPYHTPHDSNMEKDDFIFSDEFSLEDESSAQEGDGEDDESILESSSLINDIISMFDEPSPLIDELEEEYEESGPSSRDLSSSPEESHECLEEEEWQEESSSEASLCFPESEESSPSGEELSEEEYVDPSEKTVVKVPVLLSCVTVDIDFMETLDVPTDICEMIDMELSLHSLETKVVSPSCYAFISGVIRAELQYNNGTSVQLLKLPIPLEKVVPVKWRKQPLLPYSNKKEYYFGADGGQESNPHMEFYQTFIDPIECEGKSVRVVSHHESLSDGKFHIHGTAQLVINLLQQQYVTI
ncbi:hypothetical protein SAMN04487936_104175 [Halobacillus dabanensis]|uniref:SipL SPOCS domain-containing protein n=1 Tax=Halobacillus dabanensis TaxID=240302 RepID=A0A1I3U3I4_HALDA|nr:hypothetical protein [Halobacillus dabanensis]SFJ78084.1 hypothetical protein SAMN04487936_104175 [Halobacillus dabanensis]